MKGKEEENMREWDGWVEEKTERESKERAILIEWAIIGLGRNLDLKKLSEIHKDDLR